MSSTAEFMGPKAVGAEKPKGRNTSRKSYNEFMKEKKINLYQLLGTVFGAAAIIVPLILWGVDSKFEAVNSKFEAFDSKIALVLTEIKSNNNNVNSKFEAIDQRLDDQYRYIDARVANPPPVQIIAAPKPE